MKSSEKSAEANNPSPKQITHAVSEALFYLYGQTELPEATKVVSHMVEATSLTEEYCHQLVGKLVVKSYLFESEDSLVSFGTNGLWFLENSYMHGEEVDSAALAEHTLLQSRFFE